MAPDAAPVVSVAVASHGRPLRLRWLLNALEEQDLDEPWEVVVAHTYDPGTTARVLVDHPLHAGGRLRQIAVGPDPGSASQKRNLAWREARAPLVAFTDDDCRPDRSWLSNLLAVARAHPGAVVQGATRPDPHERAILGAPHVRTLLVDPTGPYAQTCNILYPREVLARIDGFDERAFTGEDCGLLLRARHEGADYVAAHEAKVFHAVESHSLPGIVRQNLKWGHLPHFVAQHPEFRAHMPLRIFWDAEHLRTTGLMVALAGARRHPAALAAGLPYVRHAMRRRGGGRRRLIAAAEIPGQAVRQIAEVVVMAYGGVRSRTPVL